MASARVTGPGVQEARVLAAKLASADRVARRALRKRLGEVAGPLADSVRASIETMPAKSQDHSLRDEVAATVYSSVRFTQAGVRVDIVSAGSRMPEGKHNMPAHLDDARGWSHPVYPRGPRFRLGPSRARRYRYRPRALKPLVHRGAWTWVHQVGKPGWFETPVIKQAPRAQAAAKAAIEDARRHLS